MQFTLELAIWLHGLLLLKSSIIMHPNAQISTSTPILCDLMLSKSSGAINLVVPMHTVVCISSPVNLVIGLASPKSAIFTLNPSSSYISLTKQFSGFKSLCMIGGSLVCKYTSPCAICTTIFSLASRLNGFWALCSA